MTFEGVGMQQNGIRSRGLDTDHGRGEEGKACGRLRVTGMPGVEGARGKGGPTWRAGGPGHKCPFVEWGTGSPRRILS